MKIIKFANDMSSITRWSQMHCMKNESVLEHTGFVAIYSLHLAYKHSLPLNHILEKAVVHDMEEVLTGDIPTTTKYINKDILNQIKRIEYNAAGQISEDVFGGKMLNAWSQSKDIATQSGCIVAIADLAAVVCKIVQEVDLGNKKFLEFIPRITEALMDLVGIWKGKFNSDIFELIEVLESMQ